MRRDKYNRAMAEYKGFRGHVTVSHIHDMIPASLAENITGQQYGAVMNTVNTAYHAGRSSCGGAEIIDDCVWIPVKSMDNGGILLPLSVVSQIVRKGNRYTVDAID